MSRHHTIYMFARAEEFKEMLAILVRSLRGIGQFKGTILCFVDGISRQQREGNDGSQLCVPIDAGEWMVTSPWAMDRLVCMGLLGHANLSATVTLMDSDIICMGDINPMLERCADTGKIVHQEETWQRYRDCRDGDHYEMYLQAMSPAQRAACAHLHPINAGVLTVPGMMIHDLRSLWSICAKHMPAGTGARKPDSWARDQASLNQVLRFQMQDRCAIYAPYDVANASMTPPSEWNKYALVHFAGYANRLEIMRRIAAS